MKRFLNILGSIRLAIVLLIILTVISLFGVVIPQGLESQLYIHKWGNIIGGGLLLTGTDHIFSTWWFYAVLIVLSLNIIVCSVSRLLNNVSRSLKPRFISSSDKIEAMKHSVTLSSSSAIESITGNISRLLKGHFYLVRKNVSDGTVQLQAYKGISKDIGSLIFHLSLVALLLGGLIGKMGGYSYVLELKNGDTFPVRDRSFLIHNDWFKLDVNENGDIKDYKSKLILMNPDSSVIKDKIIEVNSPLSYQGIRFYQASYGKVMDHAEEIFLHLSGSIFDSSTYYENFSLNKPRQFGDLTVRVDEFLTDFVIDMDSHKAISRSRDHNNPAAHVIFTKGADTLYSHWVFLKHPGIHSPDGPYKVLFRNYTPSYFTGIQVRQNPGVPVIWVGIILMTIGLYFVFYVSKRNIWVLLTKKGDGSTQISLGGTSYPAQFKPEFDKICGELKRM